MSLAGVGIEGTPILIKNDATSVLRFRKNAAGWRAGCAGRVSEWKDPLPFDRRFGSPPGSIVKQFEIESSQSRFPKTLQPFFGSLDGTS